MQQLKGEDTKRVFQEQPVRRLPPNILRRARMRLQRVIAARRLSDLRLPPSHRLEALHGDREGQHSIRINDQWRVCFFWTEQGAMEIDIADYHRGSAPSRSSPSRRANFARLTNQRGGNDQDRYPIKHSNITILMA